MGSSPLDDALGLTLEHAADGVARLRLAARGLGVVPDERPYLHGGALASCVDTASWYAVTAAEPGDWTVASLHLDFLRPAGDVPHLVLARCRRAGRRSATVDVDVVPEDDPDRPVALGRATLARLG
jgi:uncharacterized protein (TIGR00369 family)